MGRLDISVTKGVSKHAETVTPETRATIAFGRAVLAESGRWDPDRVRGFCGDMRNGGLGALTGTPIGIGIDSRFQDQ